MVYCYSEAIASLGTRQAAGNETQKDSLIRNWRCSLHLSVY